MTQTNLSQQIAKVRAKIAEYRTAYQNASDLMDAADLSADFAAARDAFLEAKKIANRIGGEIKRMARKAVEMHYGTACDWYKYETVNGYVGKFNEIFANWK